MWQELRRVLGDGGVELSNEELLDAVWLAGRLPPGAATALAAAAPPAHQAPDTEESGEFGPTARPHQEEPSTDVFPGGATPSVQGAGDSTGAPSGRGGARRGAELHGPPTPRAADAPVSRPAVPVRAPEARALASAELRIGRALRPLKQLRPDRHAWELDEPATVTAIAETGLPDVVLRPARTRWLDLVLLVDDGVSMLLWQRLAAETRTLMERSGAFRDVRVYALDSRGSDAPVLRHHPFTQDIAALPVNAIADAGGHTLLLVVSDGVGPAWRDGRMHQVLERAARNGPTAVLHALPERLWDGSGIRAEPWRVTTRRRGAANRTWRVADPVLPPELAPYRGVPVPVLAPTPESVGDWARLVGSSGTSMVLPLLAPRTPPRPYAATRTGGGDALLRFRDAASPQAYRLAAHLAAVAPVSVPAMRLVQDALGPEVDTGHLAEVFLGGLMRGADGPERDLLPQHRGFDFAENARRILLDTVPPAELVRTTRAVTSRMAELTDRTAGFPAWLPHPSGRDGVADGARPFGWVDDRLLRRLGMPAPTAGPAEAEVSGEASAPVSGLSDTGTDTEAETGTDTEAGAGAPEPRPSLPAFVDRPGSHWVSLQWEGPRSAGPYRLVARRLGGWPRIGVYLGTADDHASYAMLRIPELVDRSTAYDLLTTEAEALARLGAEHAPRLLGMSTRSEPGWLATECLVDPTSGEPAPTLRTHRTGHAALPAAQFLSVGRQFAAAMAEAHREGLVHGTLLPNSVLLAGEDVRVTGWMTASVDGAHSSHREAFRQQVAYEAPELVDDPEAPTPATDMFAVGSILLAALTGEPDSSFFSLPLLPRVAGVPAEVSSLLVNCLAEDPSARPTADELLWAFAPDSRPAVVLDAVPLGAGGDGRPVSLDINAPDQGGLGPHGLIRGGTDAGRHDLLTAIVLDLAAAHSADALTVVCADYSGTLRRSALSALPHVVWCEGVGGLPVRLRELTGLLLKERVRRTDSEAADLPRLLVVLGDLDRIAGTEESFFALADEAAALSRCEGVHVIVSQQGRSALLDLLAPSYMIELGSPYARLRSTTATPVDFSPAPPHTSPARGWDHDERHAYGVTLLRDGRPELALRVLSDVVTAREAALGPEHEAALSSRYERAFALLSLGRNAEALEEYRQVAQDRSRVLGPDHPGTLDARQQAAFSLGLLRRYSEALTLYLEVLSKRERLQGAAHEDTMRCRHNVASTLASMGRLTEAYKVARDTYRARADELGELHADTLVTLHELALVTARMERWAEAAELYDAVARGWTRNLGAGHPDTVAAAANAATARQRLGGRKQPPASPKSGG
ncbi:SAV_2336 N-terminal domain-related protein [Streptomyces sp. NPDC054841]